MANPFDSIESIPHMEWMEKQRKDLEEQERKEEAFLKISIKVALWTSVLIFSFIMGSFFLNYVTNAGVQYPETTVDTSK